MGRLRQIKNDDLDLNLRCMGYWPSLFGQHGWILAKFFFSEFMDRDEVKVHKLAKKRTRPISSHLDRTNLVNKGFIIWLLGKFCLRDTAGSPERARWLHLARSWPARGTSHIISAYISRLSITFIKKFLISKSVHVDQSVPKYREIQGRPVISFDYDFCALYYFEHSLVLSLFSECSFVNAGHQINLESHYGSR